MKKQQTKKPTEYLEDLERLSEKQLNKVIEDIKKAGEKYNKGNRDNTNNR